MRNLHSLAFIFGQFLCLVPVCSQQEISVDLGVIRAKNHHHVGVNVSGFYHFNEHVLGGLEVNRFFPVTRVIDDGELRFSGWDLELNFHYLIPLNRTFKLYPVAGAGHTIETEIDQRDGHKLAQHSWTANTGIGLNAKMGHWLPHIEYIFSWGRLNQEFILIGAGYEISWGHHSKKDKSNP